MTKDEYKKALIKSLDTVIIAGIGLTALHYAKISESEILKILGFLLGLICLGLLLGSMIYDYLEKKNDNK